eukprot:jgi/Mesvir1/10760/Mv13828-RA.1
MSRDILCRYYVHGACNKGSSCSFSHDKSKPVSEVCRYYLQGTCVYGSRCRYEHTRSARTAERLRPSPSTVPASTSSASATRPAAPSSDVAAASSTAARTVAAGASSSQGRNATASSAAAPAWSLAGSGASLLTGRSPPRPRHQGQGVVIDDFDYDDCDRWERGEMLARAAPAASAGDDTAPRWQEEEDEEDDDNARWAEGFVSPDDEGEAGTSGASIPLCRYALKGPCGFGDKCHYLHGELCPFCNRECLHPFNPQQQEQHLAECQVMSEHKAALKASEDIECSICLEKVLSKPDVAERKFGILSGCEHPFCLKCIREWRSAPQERGLEVDTIRACPLCRQPSFLVTPSPVWVTSAEAKDALLVAYKAKLSTIDCRHFDFGDGQCPFGTSCFYRHADRSGNKVKVSLRHLGTAEGVKIADVVR